MAGSGPVEEQREEAEGGETCLVIRAGEESGQGMPGFCREGVTDVDSTGSCTASAGREGCGAVAQTRTGLPGCRRWRALTPLGLPDGLAGVEPGAATRASGTIA